MLKAFCLSALAFVCLMGAPAMAAVETGKPAPDFTAKDTNGVEHTLSGFKGKVVVLEWTNPECPYVKKHYEPKNMQTLQKDYTDKGVVWISINSSAEGKQGHQTNEDANKYMTDVGSAATARIADADGAIGKLYDAKTTPHMFVIDKDGNVAYHGAIDDNDSANPADAATAKNHVKAALDSVLAGTPVETAQTKPYGCSVKYKD
jgi:peroxiredoxin